MNEQKNNGRGIFYGVIGVATLVVAIIGATFAYFTASATNSNTITGNMATINLSLAVRKVTKADEEKGGMIPMSNSMVEASVSKNDVCIDDNGNAVCQVYEITLTNDSTASQFVDGYVALRGGSGTATDEASATTTMRWAQVFPADLAAGATPDEKTKYTTAGTIDIGSRGEGTETVTLTAIDAKDDITGKNTVNIKTSGVTDDNFSIFGNTGYQVINTNYIRISNHTWNDGGEETFDRKNDITSALIFNHNVPAKSATGDANIKKYYFVVWLSETGTDQTAGDGSEGSNPVAEKFFNGNVTFISAQGSEVSATFSGYSRVPSQEPNTP